MRLPCEKANPECRYFYKPPPPELDGQNNGCFSDSSHLIARVQATNKPERYYVSRPDNIIQECRSEHDDRTTYEHRYGHIYPMPPIEVIAEAIQDDIDSGKHIGVALLRATNVLLEQSVIKEYWGLQDEC